MNGTLLSPHDVAAFGTGADLERIPARTEGQPEIKTDAKAVRMAARASSDLADASTLPKCVVQRETQSRCGKAERIEKIALAGAVRSNQDRQRRQFDIAGGDALVNSEDDPGTSSWNQRPSSMEVHLLTGLPTTRCTI